MEPKRGAVPHIVSRLSAINFAGRKIRRRHERCLPVVQAVITPSKNATVYPVLGAISFCHTLNDMLQSLLPAIYPILKGGYDLSFSQVGLLTLTYQITASLLQPVVGLYTDKRPMPFSLAVGMGFTLIGLLLLAEELLQHVGRILWLRLRVRSVFVILLVAVPGMRTLHAGFGQVV